MKRVLVTGGTGFIGRHSLSPLLEKGYEVHAVSSQASPEGSLPDVRWHRADLLDEDSVSTVMARVSPSHLLHFAWFAEPGKYHTSPENLRWVRASLGLLQEFERRGGRRVVMAGSCAEYDWDYGYCSERLTPLSPTTLYGSCKHSLQVVLEAFAGQTGLSAAWGRVFFLYGPREPPGRLVSSVVRSLLRGEPALCSHGTQVRDFLYVQDIADAFATLLESEVEGPVNVGSGRPVAVGELVRTIAEKTGRPDLIRIGALPAPESDPPLLVADVSRLRDQVGWTPAISLDSGLDRTIDWWKGHAYDN